MNTTTTSFFGFSCPNLLLVFLNLFFLVFSQDVLGLSLGLFIYLFQNLYLNLG